MANDAHVMKLKEGVEVWNAWRNQHPDVIPNLSNANLHAMDLSGADLHSANLSGADISLVFFNFANLSNANLSKANLYGANLCDADLSKAKLIGANFNGVKLFGADLSEAIFSKAKGLTADRLSLSSTLYQAEITTIMKNQIMERHPELFHRQTVSISS